MLTDSQVTIFEEYTSDTFAHALCSDWRELKAQVAALTTQLMEQDKDVLSYQTDMSELQAQNVGEAKVLEQNEHLMALCETQQKEIATLAANLEAARGELRDVEYGYKAQIAELGLSLDTAARDSAKLEEERDEARKALADLQAEKDMAQHIECEEHAKLAYERDEARKALAEVNRYWWPAFEKMSRATKDQLKQAKWQERDASRVASQKEQP